jgi:3-oxoacyl-[acyl-carrier protein] reductase
MKLVDKVAIITGGSRGIGKAIVKSFLLEGARVFFTSRHQENINNTIKELYPISRHIQGKVVDITSYNDVENFIKFVIQQSQKIDILVNNAGVGIFKKLGDTSVEDFELMINTNFRSVFNFCRCILPNMIERKTGTIVNIASLSGKNGFATGSLYCASKFAVHGFSESIMLEAREHNIRVITLFPGSVDTEFFNNANIQPMNRDKILKPEDVASIVTFSVTIDKRCMFSEIDMRPTNPK